MSIFHNDSRFASLYFLVKEIDFLIQKTDFTNVDHKEVFNRHDITICTNKENNIVEIYKGVGDVAVCFRNSGITVFEGKGSNNRLAVCLSDSVDFDEIHNAFKGNRGNPFRLEVLFEIHEMVKRITKYTVR